MTDDRRPARGDRPARSGSAQRGDWSSRTRSATRSERGARDPQSARDQRKPRDRGGANADRVRPQIEVPEIPEEITGRMLDKDARARLRTLSKDNAEDVARHLVMAGALIDEDPELAYKHAQVALARGGRVDIVREAAALTAYATGRWAEALKEFRTVRRLSGDISYLPHMADCERGLGRPERAIALANEPEASRLPAVAQAELALVVAGARMDLGQVEAAYAVLQAVTATDPVVRRRRDAALVDVLEVMGRETEAAELVRRLETSAGTDEPDVVVYDLADGDDA